MSTSKMVVVKEWLKKCMGADVNYLNDTYTSFACECFTPTQRHDFKENCLINNLVNNLVKIVKLLS